MELIIITGMSGAGKSRAINAMEDIGYFCVDNMPPKLIPTFAELCIQTKDKPKKVALVSDVRGGEMFGELFGCLDELTAQHIDYKILFLNAAQGELLRRFRETRRRHPLSDVSDDTLPDLIRREYDLLKPVHARADYVIDTTALSPAQLKDRLCCLFLGEDSSALTIHCISFGFKYGSPVEADLVFDVRCLPNPHYIDDLRGLTGLDMPVKEYIMSFPQSAGFESRLLDMTDYLLPLYSQEGKSQLVIAFGCTGGKHRSVAFAEKLYKHLLQKGYRTSVSHRDITKNS